MSCELNDVNSVIFRNNTILSLFKGRRFPVVACFLRQTVVWRRLNGIQPRQLRACITTSQVMRWVFRFDSLFSAKQDRFSRIHPMKVYSQLFEFGSKAGSVLYYAGKSPKVLGNSEPCANGYACCFAMNS